MSTAVIVHETSTLRNPLPPNSPPNGRKTPANGKTTAMGTGTFVVVLGEMVLNQIADGSGVVDVDSSSREAGVKGLACQGLVAG